MVSVETKQTLLQLFYDIMTTGEASVFVVLIKTSLKLLSRHPINLSMDLNSSNLDHAPAIVIISRQQGEHGT